MYGARERAIRDYQSAINSARQDGEEFGELRGRLLGKIATLQEILG